MIYKSLSKLTNSISINGHLSKLLISDKSIYRIFTWSVPGVHWRYMFEKIVNQNSNFDNKIHIIFLNFFQCKKCVINDWISSRSNKCKNKNQIYIKITGRIYVWVITAKWNDTIDYLFLSITTNSHSHWFFGSPFSGLLGKN